MSYGENDMISYTILLLTEAGATHETLEIEFESDDAAIDHVGSLPHADVMVLRQGDREVARFAPLARTLRTSFPDPEDSKS